MQQNNINQKTINNAISAYFMLFVGVLLLLNKKNKYVANDFVRNHIKTGFFIQLLFLLNYIIFISYSFLKSILLFGFNLNYILASTIFIILFGFLLYGSYKAKKQETFKIADIFKIGKVEKIIDINGDGILDEKDKLTLILSYIPIIGYYISSEHYEEKNISNIIKLNLYISVIITLIYISGNKNIVLLFGLFYIVFTVFSSINIIAREKIIGLNLDFLPSPTKINIYIKSFYKYLLNYFSKNEFLGLKTIINKDLKNYRIQEKKEELGVSKLPKTKFPNYLIYFPFINLSGLFFKNSNKQYHIINGVFITIFFIIYIILDFYNIISSNSYIILLFPIFFGYGFIESRPAYKMPIIYDFYKIIVYIKNIFIKTKKTIKTKQSKVHSETIKVGEIKK